MNDLFDFKPRLIVGGNEPSLWKIIYRYYHDTGYWTSEEAANLTNAYIQAWVENAKQSNT